jgi:hypothetical protein
MMKFSASSSSDGASQAASTAARASSSLTGVNRFPIAAPPNDTSVTSTAEPPRRRSGSGAVTIGA